ncbi:hypothetical protein SDC9_168932 [bioreactor metagenome]|uniref:Uncharacterized protein n=1 Tax=bioreactor metagenome TaxID=1076179 RepID=A0A645G6E1_9ZZZZ
MPVTGQCLESGVIVGRVAVEQQAGEYPQDAEDAPGGMYQVVEGQVIVDGEENPRFPVDAVRQVPVDFEDLHDGVTEGDDQPGDQPDHGAAVFVLADGVDRAGDAIAAGDHQQGDAGAGEDIQALGAFVEGVRKMGAGDEIHREQYGELDELAGDADPDPLVAGDVADRGFWRGEVERGGVHGGAMEATRTLSLYMSSPGIDVHQSCGFVTQGEKLV